MPNGKKYLPRGLLTLIYSPTTGMDFYQQHPKACVVCSGIRYISRRICIRAFFKCDGLDQTESENRAILPDRPPNRLTFSCLVESPV